LRENAVGLQRLWEFFESYGTSEQRACLNLVLNYYISTFEALERGSSELLQELNENRQMVRLA